MLCAEEVSALNSEIARLKALGLNLGTPRRDTREMREKVARCRHRCLELCRQAKDKTACRLTSHGDEADVKALSTVGACMECLDRELLLLMRLCQTFPSLRSRSHCYHQTKADASTCTLDALVQMTTGSLASTIGIPGPNPEVLDIRRQRRELAEMLSSIGCRNHEAKIVGLTGDDEGDREPLRRKFFRPMSRSTVLCCITCRKTYL